MLRRLASVAVLAVVGAAALAGCRPAPPSVAAQIGDFQITNERVDQIVEQIDTEVAAARQANPSTAPAGEATGLAKEQFGDIRATVVQLSVFGELARRFAVDNGLSLPAQDYKAAAGQIGLSESNPYIKLAVDADAYRSLLLANAKPTAPTEVDLQEAYRKVAAGGGQVPPFDEVKPQLQALPELSQGLGLRAELLAATDRYDVVVNPRYQPLEMPLAVVSSGQSQIVLVSMPLGTAASPAVRDLPGAGQPAA